MQGQEYVRGDNRIIRIKSVDPLSLAKIQGAIGLIIGLFLGGLVVVISLVLAGAATHSGGPSGGQGWSIRRICHIWRLRNRDLPANVWRDQFYCRPHRGVVL